MPKTVYLCLIVLLLASCTATTPIATPAGFDWQGHRGCRGLLPENSIPAFLRALEFPEITTLELDLAVSKDNQLIVSHEPWFNPIICQHPNGDSVRTKEAEKLLLYQKTVAEIREYDCGSRGNPRFPEQQKMKTWKPTLREVVTAVHAKKRAIRWNIEIKSEPDWDGIRHPSVDVFADLVLREIADLGIAKECVIQSFDVRPLQYIHRKNPDITLALLVENVKGLQYNLRTLGFQPDIYSPYYQLISRKTVQKCRKSGIKLIPWTVNNPKDMRALIRLGVDGIITDYPDRIKASYERGVMNDKR
jgi:glycerophosphoryl diester phosphodiesterase